MKKVKHIHIKSVICWLLLLPGLASLSANVNKTAPVNDFESLQAAIASNLAPKEKLKFLQQAQIQQWPPFDKGRYYALLANSQETNNQFNDALDSYHQAISILTPLEVSEALINAHIRRANIRYFNGASPGVYCQDRKMALKYARALNQPETLVKAISALAFCHSNAKGFHKGLALLEEAVEIAQQANLSVNRQALIYNSTASIYGNNQLFEKATEYLEKAYELWATVNERGDMFNMQQSLVALNIRLGQWDKAQDNVTQLFKLAESSTELEDFEFFAHYSAGFLAHKQNKSLLALTHLKQAKDLKNTTKELLYVRNLYAYLAISHFKLNQLEQAVQAAKQYIAMKPREKDIENRLIAESIIGLNNNQHKQAIENMLNVIDFKNARHLSFTQNATLINSQQHDIKVTQYENQLLEKQLAIHQLTLEQIKDRQRIAHQTSIIISLIALALSIIIILLYQSRKAFKKRSQTDYLTQIANRSFVFESGQKLLNKMAQIQKPFSVIIFDIDKFKSINDTYGHDIGDKAIQAVTSQAQHWISKNDLLGRIGGEEFLLILPDTTQDKAYDIAERLREGIESKTFTFGDISIKFTISLGVASYEGTEKVLDGLVASADKALYQAKNSGRNKTVNYNISQL